MLRNHQGSRCAGCDAEASSNDSEGAANCGDSSFLRCQNERCDQGDSAGAGVRGEVRDSTTDPGAEC